MLRAKVVERGGADQEFHVAGGLEGVVVVGGFVENPAGGHFEEASGNDRARAGVAVEDTVELVGERRIGGLIDGAASEAAGEYKRGKAQGKPVYLHGGIERGRQVRRVGFM